MNKLPDWRSGFCAGLDIEDLPPEQLFAWMLKPRHPVLTCEDARGTVFIERMLSGEPISFVYRGGSKPGAIRTITVSLVFKHEPAGRIYVSGYCQESKANRIFALDLIVPNCVWN